MTSSRRRKRPQTDADPQWPLLLESLETSESSLDSQLSSAVSAEDLVELQSILQQCVLRNCTEFDALFSISNATNQVSLYTLAWLLLRRVSTAVALHDVLCCVNRAVAEFPVFAQVFLFLECVSVAVSKPALVDEAVVFLRLAFQEARIIRQDQISCSQQRRLFSRILTAYNPSKTTDAFEKLLRAFCDHWPNYQPTSDQRLSLCRLLPSYVVRHFEDVCQPLCRARLSSELVRAVLLSGDVELLNVATTRLDGFAQDVDRHWKSVIFLMVDESDQTAFLLELARRFCCDGTPASRRRRQHLLRQSLFLESPKLLEQLLLLTHETDAFTTAELRQLQRIACRYADAAVLAHLISTTSNFAGVVSFSSIRNRFQRMHTAPAALQLLIMQVFQVRHFRMLRRLLCALPLRRYQSLDPHLRRFFLQFVFFVSNPEQLEAELPDRQIFRKLHNCPETTVVLTALRRTQLPTSSWSTVLQSEFVSAAAAQLGEDFAVEHLDAILNPVTQSKLAYGFLTLDELLADPGKFQPFEATVRRL